MQRIEMISSDISSIGYKPQESTLEIEFYDLCVYKYFWVPRNIYSWLIWADSHGRYFDNYIKGKYSHYRVIK